MWDFFEIDSNFDLDDDTGQNNGNFFSGDNCVDNDDDGNDADADDDGFYQAVWDRGIMSQGLRIPSLYDVDNDNDGVPMVKTRTMTTMGVWTSTKNNCPAASGVRNNPLGTTTTTASSIGLTTIGTETD